MLRSISRMLALLLGATLSAAPLLNASPLPAGGGALAPLRSKERAPGALTCARPANAVVLFNGKDLRDWHQPNGRPAAWKVENGVMTVADGNIVTQETFADAYLHVEFRIPYVPRATGQERGNSGVYLQGRYEIQVLDSYGINVPGKGDCGAIYGQHATLLNACKPPLEWQSYDAIFRAPRVDASGKVTEPGRITVLQNGLVIQNNVEIFGPTAGAMDADVAKLGPLLLQDHGCPLQYRNIWLVRLPPKGSEAY